MAYIEIDQYLDWGGKITDESAFARLSYRAEKMIDKYTQSRIRKMKEVPDAVKRCMVELVNIMANADPADLASKPVIQSFNNDGYSESYAEPLTMELVLRNTQNVILDYLSEEKDDNGTPMLYLGVD